MKTKVATRMMMRRASPTRSDSYGMLASLFSPFWCLDAKGGEVALFRYRDLHGLDTSRSRFLHLLACVHFILHLVFPYLNYVGLVVRLFICVCKTCDARYA